MAEATKSILLIDYDSIHRSLSANDSDATERLAPRIAAWIGALEAGSLFTDKPGTTGRRRVLIRRCYADPALLGDDRAAFLANGFQVVDCPIGEGRERNAAAIHMVLDSIEALDHPAGYEEFILFSADSDLSPLLIQLRAHNRQTAVYATEVTTDSYKAIADAIVEEPLFVAVLTSETEVADETADEEEEAHPPATRQEIEALARKISSATNVPLFAPRTFAELFRHLVEEIAENGYHFQTTAENVANRMAEAGRNVSRRQVIFVVKGLALKGHVFSTGDTPERLADVFREQVLFLAENAGLSLDDDERRIMSSWIVGQGAAASPSGGQEPEQKKKSASAADADKTDSAKRGNGQSGRSARKRPSSGTSRSGTSRTGAETKSAESTGSEEAEKSKAAGAPRQSTTASKSTSSATAEPASRTSSAASSNAATAAAAAPSRSRSKTADDDNEDAVEDSILAAIAQAVDVLVEDSDNSPDETVGEPDEVETESKSRRSSPPADVEPDEEVDENTEGDDIGDEIQRIIASYSRNRNKDG